MLAMMQQAAVFLTGPFGIAVTIVAVAAAFLGGMPPWRFWPASWGFLALLLGSIAITSGWLVNTFVPLSG